MKKHLLYAAALLLAGCGEPTPDCTFTKAHITASEAGTNKVLQDKTIEDCFTASAPDSYGLIEIKGSKTGENFKVAYYAAEADMLNVKIGGKLTEWRKNKGHDIFVNGAPGTDTLGFIFGDRLKSKIKGTIIFSK